MSEKNTIMLKLFHSDPVIEEREAAEAIIPGQLIDLDSADKFAVRTAGEGYMFALANTLEGETIDDTIAAGTRVKGWIPQKGDEVLAILDDGQNVAIGAKLTPSGANMTANANGPFMALEAMDLSDSSGGESEDSATGYDKRIMVKCLR